MMIFRTLGVAAMAAAAASSSLAQDVTGASGAVNAPSPSVEQTQLVEFWNGREGASRPADGVEQNGWNLAASMPLARSEHAVAALDGKVYVIGGYPPGRIPSNLVQVFDPVAGSWALGPRLPQPIHHTVAAAAGGKLYVIGGEFDGAGTGRPSNFLAHVWELDPVRGGWIGRAPMPTARGGGGAAVIDGKIYVVGGRPPNGAVFEVFDPAANTWTGLPDLPTQRNHLAVAAVGGKIVVAGGRSGAGFDSARTDIVEIYDPTTRRWSRGAPLPAPRAGITGAALGSCMLVFAGEGERNVLGLTPTTYAYSLAANRWRRLADLPIAVHGLKGSAVIGDQVYLPGGAVAQGGNLGTNAVQVFRPGAGCD